MAIDTSNFRNGLALIVDGEICQILEFQHVKPGKGGAFVRTRLRRLRQGTTVEKTFRAGEKFDDVFLEKVAFQYLYRQGNELVLMDTESYEQITVPESAIGDGIKYLKEEMEMVALRADGEILGYEIPPFVELEVTETDPGFKGDTVSGSNKPATLETGAVVQVPFHIKQGEIVKVDTRTDTYLERVNKK